MKAQQPMTSRGLSGEDRSYHDSFVNLALRDALSELRTDSAVASSPDDAPVPVHEAPMDTEATDTVPTSTAPVVESGGVVEETPHEEHDAIEGEMPLEIERRSPFHSVAREHVASSQAQPEAVGTKGVLVRQGEQLAFVQIAELDLRQGPRKPKPLPKDAPWGMVTLGRFLSTNNTDMVSLVREIRSNGNRPVLTLEVREPEEKGTSVSFSLSIVPGKGGCEHVKLKAFTAHGIFAVLIPKDTELFHDELVLGEESAPERYIATVKVNGILNTMNAFLSERRLARQQR